MVEDDVPDFVSEAVAVPGDAAFNDLAPDTAALAEIKQELRTGSFGALDINDFRDFNASVVVPAEGEFRFSVEQRHLREATTTTKATTSASAVQYGAVKVTVFATKLKLATFNQTAFSEIMIPQAGESTIEEGKEIAFIFDHARLEKIASTFPNAVITFLYNAEKMLMSIRSGDTHLELSTLPETVFTDYHAKIGKPEMRGKIAASVLRTAVQYTGLFAKKDAIQANLSLIEYRNGQCLGGSAAALGVFASDAIGDVSFKVKFEIWKVYDAMLARLSPENSHLFETETFYLVRDENLYFGFEKTTYAFPPVDSFFATPRDEHVLIPRPHLLAALNRLAVVSVEKDLQVHLAVTGSGKDAVLTLVTKDMSGKSSRSTLNVSRFANEGRKSDFAPWDLYVNIAAFTKIVRHFQSANVHLETLVNRAKRALLVVDEDEGYTARTILNALSAEAVEKMRASKEQPEAA